MSKHYVIIIPGLGEEASFLKTITAFWSNRGLTPIIHSLGWYKGREFKPKLKKLIALIDKLHKDGKIVSLLGASASGSAVLNAFCLKKKIVHRVINVCGRLRTGKEKGFRSFESRTKGCPVFAQSVKLFEKNEKLLTPSDRKKIMTVRAKFGDELVPADTVVIRGARNIEIPLIEHALSIYCALTIFSGQLRDFLKINDY